MTKTVTEQDRIAAAIAAKENDKSPKRQSAGTAEALVAKLEFPESVSLQRRFMKSGN